MIVAFPFYLGDCHLALKNLHWQAELAGQKPNDIVLIADPQIGNDFVLQMQDAAMKAYARVHTYTVPHGPKGWPQGPNHFFHHAAHYMQQFGKPWLFHEPDAVPIKKLWLEILYSEYQRAGRPFMGVIVPTYGHMNGVGIYPADTPSRIPIAMAATYEAWDTKMAPEMIHQCHPANHLIFHAWGAVEGQIVPFDGVPPKFTTQESLNVIDPRAVLVHRDKFGSIIDRLREQRAANGGALPFCAQINHATVPVDTKVEIFIATCAKDKEYLQWNLESIRRFAFGFSGITLAATRDEESSLRPVAEKFGAKLILYNPPQEPIYRHLAAQMAKAKADTFCPDADLILFSDSDCIFTRRVSVDEYVKNGKPVLVVRAWADSESNPWQEVTERALGKKCPWDTMVRHPQIVFPQVLCDMRQAISAFHNKSFEDYVLSCKPTFMWGWSEHESIGAVIMDSHWRSKFEIIDLKYHPRPPDVLRQYWSIGPIDQPQVMPSEGRQIVPIEDIRKILA